MTARRILLLVAATLPLGTGPAAAHGWYTGLVSPSGKSCCNDRDCHPVGQCVRPDGKEGLLIEGECLTIPEGEGARHRRLAGRPRARLLELPQRQAADHLRHPRRQFVALKAP